MRVSLVISAETRETTFFLRFPTVFENEVVVSVPAAPGEGLSRIAASAYRGGRPPSLEMSSHPAEFHQRGEAAKSDAQR